MKTVCQLHDMLVWRMHPTALPRRNRPRWKPCASNMSCLSPDLVSPLLRILPSFWKLNFSTLLLLASLNKLTFLTPCFAIDKLGYQTLLCTIVRHTSSVNITCPTLNALALLCPKNGLMERETVVQILPTKKYPKVVQKMIQKQMPPKCCILRWVIPVSSSCIQ